VLCKIETTGRVVLQALNSGVSKFPASAGQFPQVSGLTMTVDPSAPLGNRVRDVKMGGVPLDPAKTYTIALPDFVMKGGDDYTALTGQRVLVGPEAGPLIVTALEHYVTAHRPVAPTIEGRITIVR
jgi:2',3'-cyclic-nucleotide 2'-phosphodiesterase (5'-nucleotidase family)